MLLNRARKLGLKFSDYNSVFFPVKKKILPRKKSKKVPVRVPVKKNEKKSVREKKSAREKGENFKKVPVKQKNLCVKKVKKVLVKAILCP